MSERRAPYHLGLLRDALGQGGIEGGAKIGQGLRVGSTEVPAGAGDVWIENSIRASQALGAGASESSYSLPSSIAWQAVPLGFEAFDSDNIVDLATSATNLTVRTGGIYIACGAFNLAYNASGNRGIGIYLDGVLLASRMLAPSSPSMAMAITAVWWANELQVFNLMAYQNCGSSLDLSDIYFSVARIP